MLVNKIYKKILIYNITIMAQMVTDMGNRNIQISYQSIASFTSNVSANWIKIINYFMSIAILHLITLSDINIELELAYTLLHPKIKCRKANKNLFFSKIIYLSLMQNALTSWRFEPIVSIAINSNLEYANSIFFYFQCHQSMLYQSQ